MFICMLMFIAEEISVVQKEVDVILKGRVLVGHAITNDEKVSTFRFQVFIYVGSISIHIKIYIFITHI